MANMVDLLLSKDVEEIERPQKEIEITRLSNLFGEKFTLLCKAVSATKYKEIERKALNMKDLENPTIDIEKLQMELVLNGAHNPADGTRFFSNKDLQKHFGVPNYKELIKKLLLAGEIEKVADTVQKLTGYTKNAVVEIKN